MKQYTATANDEGVRLSRFVQSVTRDFPTSLLYKSFRNKRVKVNGKKAAPEYRIQTGDLIELYINDEFFDTPTPENAFLSVFKPQLDILYMTRVQRERFFNEDDYVRLKDSYILTPDKLRTAKWELAILHPLPRVNEISIAIDDDPRACYFRQVLCGKFIRMALILKLLEVE